MIGVGLDGKPQALPTVDIHLTCRKYYVRAELPDFIVNNEYLVTFEQEYSAFKLVGISGETGYQICWSAFLLNLLLSFG